MFARAVKWKAGAVSSGLGSTETASNRAIGQSVRHGRGNVFKRQRDGVESRRQQRQNISRGAWGLRKIRLRLLYVWCEYVVQYGSGRFGGFKFEGAANKKKGKMLRGTCVCVFLSRCVKEWTGMDSSFE